MQALPEGVFAMGEGVEITAEEDGLTLTLELSALVEENDALGVMGVSLEVEQDGELETSILLDAEECEALAELLQRAAEQLRSGEFEQTVRTNLAQENAENGKGA